MRAEDISDQDERGKRKKKRERAQIFFAFMVSSDIQVLSRANNALFIGESHWFY